MCREECGRTPPREEVASPPPAHRRAGGGNVLAQQFNGMLRAITVLSLSLSITTIACVPTVKRSGGAPSAAQMTEFWIDPGASPRDLFAGPPAGGHVRPATDSRFSVV